MLERGRLIKAAGGEFNHALDLFAVEAVIPLHNLVKAGARFEIFKDGRNGHARSFENPRAADLSGYALNDRTQRPVERGHGVSCSTFGQSLEPGFKAKTLRCRFRFQRRRLFVGKLNYRHGSNPSVRVSFSVKHIPLTVTVAPLS